MELSKIQFKDTKSYFGAYKNRGNMYYDGSGDMSINDVTIFIVEQTAVTLRVKNCSYEFDNFA